MPIFWLRGNEPGSTVTLRFRWGVVRVPDVSLARRVGLADGGEDCVDGLGGGEVGGGDGVGGDALVVGAAEAEAALGEIEVGEVGAGGGGGVGGLGGAAGDEGIEGGGEVDDGGMGSLLEEEAVAELFGGSASEGEDDAALAEERGEGEGFEVAEVGLAVVGEELGNGGVVAGFDLAVEVEEYPAEAVGEESSGGGFAGAHEAGEDDAVEDGGLEGRGFGFGWHV
jgi:hypothetical protein